jgi:hypothetical protein
MGRFGVNGGEHGDVVGDAAIGDPELGAVQDIIVAVRLGQAAQAGDIRSHGGFGSGKGEEFTVPGDGGKVFLLGGFIVAENQRFHPQGIVEDAGGQAGADGRQFFRGHDAVQHPVPLSAVCFGDVAVDQAGVVGFVQNVHGRFFPLVIFPCHREQFFQRKFTGFFLDRFLFGTQGKIQHEAVSSKIVECTSWVSVPNGTPKPGTV